MNDSNDLENIKAERAERRERKRRRRMPKHGQALKKTSNRGILRIHKVSKKK